MKDLEELAKLVVERFDRLEAKVDGLKDSLDAVGGHLAVKIDRLEAQVQRIGSDAEALTEAFIPAEENQRRIRALERGQKMLEQARDELRGRQEDVEHRLYAVQAGRAGNGHGE